VLQTLIRLQLGLEPRCCQVVLIESVCHQGTQPVVPVGISLPMPEIGLADQHHRQCTASVAPATARSSFAKRSATGPAQLLLPLAEARVSAVHDYLYKQQQLPVNESAFVQDGFQKSFANCRRLPMLAATRGYADPLGQIMMQATCKEQLVFYSGACRTQLSPTPKFLRHVSRTQSDLSHSAGDLPSNWTKLSPRMLKTRIEGTQTCCGCAWLAQCSGHIALQHLFDPFTFRFCLHRSGTIVELCFMTSFATCIGRSSAQDM